MRLIDANELTEMVWRERLDTRERIVNLIARQPTIEAKPVKRGRWRKRMSTPDSLKCSVCGNNHEYLTTYCPNCGARMDGVENEDIAEIYITVNGEEHHFILKEE